MTPPRLAESLLHRILPSDERDEVIEDLRELFEHREQRHGRTDTVLWYWKQVATFAWHGVSRYESRSSRPRTGARDGLLRDVKQAFRGFRRSPAFTAMVVLTIALGIGANLATWSVVHHVLRKPFGYENEARIVRVWPEHHFTRQDYDRFRDRAGSYDAFSVFWRTEAPLIGADEPQMVATAYVSYELFRVFGVEPHLGRDFTSADQRPGVEPVVIVSHRLWRASLGGHEDVLGARLEVGGHEGARRTVVGVAPPGFRPLGGGVDLWIPFVLDPEVDDYTHMASFASVALLREGVTAAQARAEAASMATTFEPEPSYLDRLDEYSVAPFREVLVEKVEPMLIVLLGAVATVLLLCCVNVANLLLARGLGRAREVSIRRALGASRARILRQLLTENLVLGLMAGALGLMIASFLMSFIPPTLPRAEEIRMDAYTAGSTLVLSILASFVFGLLPAFRTAAAAGSLGARNDSRGSKHARAQRTLLVAELTLALVLVVCSGLLLKSFQQLRRVETGFRGENVVSLRVSPSSVRYAEPERRRQFFRDLLTTLDALPQVESAGAIQILPMTPSGMRVGISLTGDPLGPGVSPPMASYRIVTAGYRKTLGVPLLFGRDLTEGDRADGAPVGLVNETLAKELWPGRDPIGQAVHYEDGQPWFTVVGVVGDVRQHRLDAASEREVYVPFEQDSWPSSMVVVVRESAEAATLVPSLRRAVWSVDGDVPISDVRTMHDVIQASLSEHRFRTELFSGFALLALGLSAIGVYGVVSYGVSQKSKDVGIRMALGASGGRVLRETLAEGMRPVMVGLLAGSAGALVAARALSRFLYEVTPHDVWVYALVACILGGTALAAAFIPARRAASSDPVAALNADV